MLFDFSRDPLRSGSIRGSGFLDEDMDVAYGGGQLPQMRKMGTYPRRLHPETSTVEERIYESECEGDSHKIRSLIIQVFIFSANLLGEKIENFIDTIFDTNY